MGTGAISSYAAAMQNLQMSLIRQSIQAQQQAIEILTNPDNMVPTSETLGKSLDISI